MSVLRHAIIKQPKGAPPIIQNDTSSKEIGVIFLKVFCSPFVFFRISDFDFFRIWKLCCLWGAVWGFGQHNARASGLAKPIHYARNIGQLRKPTISQIPGK